MRGDARDTEHDAGDVMHCPHCLEVLPPPSHFCTFCGMPVTGYSTIAPLEHIWAFGWFINRLLSTRPSRLALLGTWVIGFPSVLAVLSLLVAIVVRPSAAAAAVVFGAPSILVVVSFTFLVIRVTYAYFRRGDSANT